MGTNVKIVSHKPTIHSGTGKNFDYDSVFSSLHGPDSYSDPETVDDVIILREHMDKTPTSPPTRNVDTTPTKVQSTTDVDESGKDKNKSTDSDDSEPENTTPLTPSKVTLPDD